jgi:hypothetical protein
VIRLPAVIVKYIAYDEKRSKMNKTTCLSFSI